VESFAKALDCGVPIYTEGTRLLRDGSNFLRDFHPGDTRLLDNARKAASIAAAANFASTLNCLRLGDDLAVESGAGYASERGRPLIAPVMLGRERRRRRPTCEPHHL